MSESVGQHDLLTEQPFSRLGFFTCTTGDFGKKLKNCPKLSQIHVCDANAQSQSLKGQLNTCRVEPLEASGREEGELPIAVRVGAKT